VIPVTFSARPLILHSLSYHTTCRETVFALRVAEKEAQAAQRFIWTGYQPAAPSACMRYFEGTVIEIVSGDTVVVVEGQHDKEIKITFSSIK
jgi:hypothetical protein